MRAQHGDQEQAPPGEASPVFLLTPGAVVPDTLGGKGRALATLVSAGLPVPPTGVVTTVAYRRVGADPEVVRIVGEIASGADVVPQRVEDTFARVTVPDDLREDIMALAATVGGGGALAVRSSATVEDLHGSSFAGQYRSILDVASTDGDAVMAAVREVWASLWRPAAVAYRKAFGVDEANVAMAVVLMRMVPADTAGVVFTVDPGGREDHARVEEVEGLGESLVSGQRTPSAWVVPRAQPSQLPDVPAAALALALQVEELSGTPQDVEWAAVNGDVMLVQARPITVLDEDDGFDSPIDEHELTAAGIVEMVPGVLPALRWENNRFLLEEAFRSVLHDLGVLVGSGGEDEAFVRRVRGRAAIDFDRLRAAAAHIPGAVDELEEQYFGIPGDVARPMPSAHRRSGLLRRMGREFRGLRASRQLTAQADIVVGATRELRKARPDTVMLDDVALRAYRRRLLDLAARALAAELGVAAAAAAAYARLRSMLIGHLGIDEGSRAAADLTTGAGLSEARTSWSSAAVFAGPSWEELGTTAPKPRSHAAEDRHEVLERVEERLRRLPGWRRRRILTGQFVDIRLHLLRRLAAEATEQLSRREDTKAAVLELGGEVRRIELELGRRLVEQGLLVKDADVELLHHRELDSMLDGRGTVTPDVLGRRRNWLSRYEAEGALPVRFRGIPDRTPEPLPEGDVVEGWAASAGRYRGRARVVRSARDPFARGEILVAEATDTSWSPLFVRAGAIVVERGGPLSHAAILARELGLPAVLNVPGATGALDGAMLVVDGDQGVVVIESRVAGDGAVPATDGTGQADSSPGESS